MYKLSEKILAMRRAGAPLAYINSPDPNSTIDSVVSSLSNGSGPQACHLPVVIWNVNQGVRALTEQGVGAIHSMIVDPDMDGNLENPVDLLKNAMNAPDSTILFMEHLNMFTENPQVRQALYTLRDEFKANSRILFGVGPHTTLPLEIRSSFIVLDEPYPSSGEIRKIAEDLLIDLDINISPKDMDKAVDAMRGLDAYSAEQEFSMVVTREGIDINELWERKRKIIELTDGLAVYRPNITFKDIGGCVQIKKYITAMLTGRRPPKAIVWIDEMDKAMAGSQTDSTGVSQDYLGTILQYMQERNSRGMIFLGPPGTSKSMVAKATGSLADILTIQLDLGGMKNSLVGESERNLREAFKVISAVADEDVLFIGTCNRIDGIDSALRRRFKAGTFFFDLPDREEKDAIWPIHLNRNGITEPSNLWPDDEVWTGAEIAACCETAFDLSLTLKEAAEYIVPVAVSNKDAVERLRKEAHARFRSASTAGFYEYSEGITQRHRRSIAV
jgi:hypothetical protein